MPIKSGSTIRAESHSSNLKDELEWGKQFERPVAEKYARVVWPGAQLIECPAYSHVDFAVEQQGKLVAFLEVKARRVKSTDYDSIIVNWHKHDFARHAQFYLQVPTYAVIAYTDAVISVPLWEQPDRRTEIIRGDRSGSAKDHAEYNHERFTYREDVRKLVRLPGQDPIIRRAKIYSYGELQRTYCNDPDHISRKDTKAFINAVNTAVLEQLDTIV